MKEIRWVVAKKREIASRGESKVIVHFDSSDSHSSNPNLKNNLYISFSSTRNIKWGDTLTEKNRAVVT